MPSALAGRIVVSFSEVCEMRPKPFVPEILDGDKRYVRDQEGGLVWHRCKSRILYADTDRSQVVYHGNYLRYFEQGRSELMRAHVCSY